MLSVGEQQRVAVARALANRPKLLLADEPTANVDTGHQQQVFELLRDTCREEKVALLLVTHSPSWPHSLTAGRATGALQPGDGGMHESLEDCLARAFSNGRWPRPDRLSHGPGRGPGGHRAGHPPGGRSVVPPRGPGLRPDRRRQGGRLELVLNTVYHLGRPHRKHSLQVLPGVHRRTIPPIGGSGDPHLHGRQLRGLPGDRHRARDVHQAAIPGRTKIRVRRRAATSTPATSTRRSPVGRPPERPG